jgi:hypothetical protein
MDLEQVIKIAGFVIVVGGIVWNFAYTQGRDKQVEDSLNQKIDSHIQDNENDFDSLKETLEKEIQRLKEVNLTQWEKIDAGKKWEEAHEKEAWGNRNDLELKISALHGADEKLHSMFISIEKKLDEKFLEQKIAIEKIFARLEK